MKRPLYSRPDAFSLSPLLSLLPVQGKVGKLEALTSSLYARYERVAHMKKDIPPDEKNRDLQRRLTAEEAMLRQVLDWLAIKPDKLK
jgi:uncharacterized protein YPO0396